MKRIKEIIVVEGRSDTARLRQVLGPVDTIETQGSAISEATLSLIKKAQAQRGVIVLTDPDFNGQRIRQKIVEAVPQVKQAFLRRQDSVPTNSHGSLGLEHASGKVIKAALQEVWTPVTNNREPITTQELLELGLIGSTHSQKMRALVGDILHIGYANSKQLPRRLTMFAISKEQLQSAIIKAKEELYGSRKI